MELETLLNTLAETPESVQFEDTMQVIEAHYVFAESEFRNGEVVNTCLLYTSPSPRDTRESRMPSSA